MRSTATRRAGERGRRGLGKRPLSEQSGGGEAYTKLHADADQRRRRVVVIIVVGGGGGGRRCVGEGGGDDWEEGLAAAVEAPRRVGVVAPPERRDGNGTAIPANQLPPPLLMSLLSSTSSSLRSDALSRARRTATAKLGSQDGGDGVAEAEDAEEDEDESVGSTGGRRPCVLEARSRRDASSFTSECSSAPTDGEDEDEVEVEVEADEDDENAAAWFRRLKNGRGGDAPWRPTVRLFSPNSKGRSAAGAEGIWPSNDATASAPARVLLLFRFFDSSSDLTPSEPHRHTRVATTDSRRPLHAIVAVAAAAAAAATTTSLDSGKEPSQSPDSPQSHPDSTARGDRAGVSTGRAVASWRPPFLLSRPRFAAALDFFLFLLHPEAKVPNGPNSGVVEGPPQARPRPQPGRRPTGSVSRPSPPALPPVETARERHQRTPQRAT